MASAVFSNDFDEGLDDDFGDAGAAYANYSLQQDDFDMGEALWTPSECATWLRSLLGEERVNDMLPSEGSVVTLEALQSSLRDGDLMVGLMSAILEIPETDIPEYEETAVEEDDDEEVFRANHRGFLKLCQSKLGMDTEHMYTVAGMLDTSASPEVLRRILRTLQNVKDTAISLGYIKGAQASRAYAETADTGSLYSLEAAATLQTTETSGSHDDSDARKVAKELIETEKVFLEDIQSVVVHYLNYLYTLQKQGGAISGNYQGEKYKLDIKDIVMQFLNLEAIVDLHQRIYAQLSNANESPAKVARVFETMSDEFMIYQTYLNGHEDSIANLSNYQKQRNGIVKQIFDQCKTEAGHALDLATYLLKPVQRVLKYPLLLREMLKKLDPNSPDYMIVANAHDAVQSAAQKLNEGKRRYEAIKRAHELQARCDPRGLGIVSGQAKNRGGAFDTAGILLKEQRKKMIIFKSIGNRAIGKLSKKERPFTGHLLCFEEAIVLLKDIKANQYGATYDVEACWRFEGKHGDKVVRCSPAITEDKESNHGVSIIRTRQKSSKSAVKQTDELVFWNESVKQQEEWLGVLNSIMDKLMYGGATPRVEPDSKTNLQAVSGASVGRSQSLGSKNFKAPLGGAGVLGPPVAVTRAKSQKSNHGQSISERSPSASAAERRPPASQNGGYSSNGTRKTKHGSHGTVTPEPHLRSASAELEGLALSPRPGPAVPQRRPRPSSQVLPSGIGLGDRPAAPPPVPPARRRTTESTTGAETPLVPSDTNPSSMKPISNDRDAPPRRPVHAPPPTPPSSASPGALPRVGHAPPPVPANKPTGLVGHRRRQSSGSRVSAAAAKFENLAAGNSHEELHTPQSPATSVSSTGSRPPAPPPRKPSTGVSPDLPPKRPSRDSSLSSQGGRPDLIRSRSHSHSRGPPPPVAPKPKHVAEAGKALQRRISQKHLLQNSHGHADSAGAEHH
eukprot:Clim_evm45s195 gene=Clim_evmTU45s195